MDIIYSVRPLLIILIPLCVVPILVSSKNENVRESWTFAAAISMFLLVASMVPHVLEGASIEYTLFNLTESLSLKFKVDAFGMLFVIVSSFLWIVTSGYSIGYMRTLKEHSQTRYYSFFALSLFSTAGVAMSANFLTMYLFYELLSFATYPLVTHHQDKEARTSGRKYLFYILGSSIAFLIPAMIITYSFTGTLDFSNQGFIAGNGISPGLLLILFGCFIFGFAKCGIMPFHSWLPAAMVAPTPVSALLHAVAVVKVGVFCIIRVVTGVFGTDLLAQYGYNNYLCYLAAFTIIVASLIALSQDGLKRRLAFSTIGQLSYIILGVALITPSGVLASMLHIAMHAFGKITLFFCAGAIFAATGIKNISEMVGIGKRMPVTMTAFFIGSLSVIGLPPCGGIISKWYLVLGTLEAGQITLLFVILTSSFLNAAYFLPIVYKAFFCTREESMFEEGVVEEPPLFCVVPLVITAAISVALFFYPQPFLNLAEIAVKNIF